MFLRLPNGLVVMGVLIIAACGFYPVELMVADYIPPVGGEPPGGITGTTGVQV
ncbi:MAG: hypothetical protein F6K00_10700 [Leptolyngbya sp. SIOISBB]|nr:hypothetical protein [Leptolyngbya sp. SIOISBB]